MVAVLRAALVVVLVVDLAVVATHGDGSDREDRSTAAGPTTTTRDRASTSTSTSASTTVVPAADTTVGAPPTSAAPTTPATRSPATTVPPVTTTPPTTPTTSPPPPSSNMASVLVQNDYPGVLDVSINMGFLQMSAGGRHETVVSAELGATSGDQVPPGSDLVTVSIPQMYGSPDAGCGSSSLSQLFAPGGRYVLRIFASGNCQLLGGSPKPTFSVSAR